MASNIIQLAFNGETSATSDELVYKYDYGQKLQFTDLELPEVFEVHFAQQRLGRAVKQIGQNNIVDIPDGLLEKGSVYGWIFLHETESDGETEYEFKIPVKNRATPTDGEITPEQESVISQTIAVLVNAKDAALDAQEAAETAQTAAESAQSGAQTAQGLAEDAQTAAETAQSLAEAAQSAAETAQDLAETAQTGAEVAQTAAETAQGLAEDARDDAIAAKDLVLGMDATAVTLSPNESATADYEDGLLTLGIPQGIQGIQGIQGVKGDDGFSPYVEVETIVGGHSVDIIDADGSHQFNVIDGTIPYYECTSGSTVTQKSATLVAGAPPTLVAGMQAFVKFTIYNTAGSPTLKLGSLEAKPIYRYGTTVAGTNAGLSWNSGAVVLFVYDGTGFIMENWLDTKYDSMTESEYKAGTSTTAKLITPKRLKDAIDYHDAVTDVEVNGTSVVSDKIAEITVPTKVSDLTNDSGYIDSSALPASLSDLTNDMSVSDFPNDVPYSSLSELEDATIVQTLSDSTPYNYRRTNNGNGAGHREYDEIVGASVGWNQLVSGVESYTNTNTDTRSTVQLMFRNGTSTSSPSFFAQNITSTGYFNKIIAPQSNGTGWSLVHNGSTRNLVFWSTAQNPPIAGHKYWLTMYFGGVDPTTAGGIVLKNVMLFDLTLFNSQIADYVYSLEQSTSGSGVSWLKSHFPKLFDNGYQPFDSGSIKSVSGLTAHEMVGVNAWDEEWELGSYNPDNGAKKSNNNAIRSKNYISVIGSETYYFHNGSNTSTYVFCYDADKNYLALATKSDSGTQVKNSKFYLVQGTAYITFYTTGRTTYANDICVNLSSSINGQYFPHESHTYPLDSSVTLRGQYKLDANNNLYADGDVWHSDGTKDVNYAEVDLGSLTWQKGIDFTPNYFLATVSGKKAGVNMICPMYVTRQSTGLAGNTDNMIIAGSASTGSIYVVNTSYTDATAFKTAMSGVYLVYELATPTTESATAYESPQWCDSKGTEEYVGSELPVGHSTDYPMTLIDTADGLSNGTYEPRITIANGKKTVTWVSV